MEKTLFSELVFLMKTFFFVYVGISIKFDSFISLLIGLGISFLMIILRIWVVRISLPADINGINLKDRAFLSMMIPRGLAAAVLATMISQSQLAGSERVSNIVFSVIFFTIIFTSVLVPLLEKSEKFRKIYTSIITFPSFKKNLYLEDLIEEEYHTNIQEDTKDIKKEKKEEKTIINDEDDVPNIFL